MNELTLDIFDGAIAQIKKHEPVLTEITLNYNDWRKQKEAITVLVGIANPFENDVMFGVKVFTSDFVPEDMMLWKFSDGSHKVIRNIRSEVKQ